MSNDFTQRVRDFWFGSKGSDDYGKTRQEWFVKNPEFDESIREAFLDDVEMALAGKYDALATKQMDSLALIVALDQFPRNLFRDTAKAFVGDKRALELANEALRMEFDKNLPVAFSMFFYLPFEHSESIDDQQRCVDMFTAAGNADLLKWAVAHRDIIDRFGRFPHRNAILARDSTEEEIAFLQEPGSSF